MRFLERQPSVDDAAADRTLAIAAVDPLLTSAWHLSKINAQSRLDGQAEWHEPGLARDRR